MKHNILILFSVFIGLSGCKEEVLPKPKAMLRLNFPKATYEKLSTKKYVFDKNTIAKVKEQNKNGITIDYPTIKGSIYLSYRKRLGEDLNRLVNR